MNTANPAPQPAPRPRRRWLHRLAAAVLILGFVLACTLGWLLGTGSGLRLVIAQAERLTHGALQVEDAHGRLAGPLDIGALRYRDNEGTDVRVVHAHLDVRLWPLLYKRLHVLDLRVERLDIALPAAQETSAPSASFSLKPPIDVIVDRAYIGPAAIAQAGKPLFVSDQLELTGRWTRAGIDVERLALRAPDGRIDLDGRIGIGQRYRGAGRALVAWKIDHTEYAGTLDAQGDGRKARFTLALTQPMAAQLQVDMSQRKNLAWTAALDVPAFDPKPLLGDSVLTRLAAHLQGQGDRYGGNVDGHLDLNDYRLLLQPVQARFDRNYETLALQHLQLASPQVKGQLGATGTIRLDATPISAALAIDWKGVELPADLVGQVLRSDGHIALDGSVEHYRATGDLAIGPPDQPARLSLDLDGSTQQIHVRTLRLNQPQGNLAIAGTLTLQPDTAWQFQASANRFDPGQLFAGWQGLLDADLATQGTLAKNAPDVTLDVRKLEGQLRQRRLRGSGRLHLSPDEVLDGTLDLASGSSSITLTAQPGRANDANVTLAIASLGDWLPQADGRMDGRFSMRGKLPKLAIAGTLQGQSLRWQAQAIQQLRLALDIPDLSQPGGHLELDAADARLGGLAFRQVRLNGNGTAAKHQLSLNAAGTPLSVALALNGTLKDHNWNGTLDSLALDMQGLPRWSLRQPARLGWNDGKATLGELCLSAGDPLLCLDGDRNKAGDIDASYRLHAVPLALVVSAIGSDLPISAQGLLEGSGKIHRSASGALTGNATIASPQGRLIDNEHPGQPLIAYSNLLLDATMAPGKQQATVHATLGGHGRLDGQASVLGAQQILSGQIGLHLDDLAFVTLFTDQLANVHGRLDGDIRLGGTLTEPTITGQAGIDDFAAEVPDAGLKLSQGRLTVSAADTRQLRIDGSVQSGKGTLAIAGSAGLDAQTPTAITFKGGQFTAIDIPAAKVVLSPDVLVRRDAHGIDATGSVRLDSAEVDLDKLPGGGVSKASPDVVVVDQPQQSAENAALPITASIKVDLGQSAHLVGMGLDGHLGGVITVNERPGRETIGQGQVSVSGTYKAYGQRLHIQHGQLLFASTPIDNPGLNIRAIRSLTPNATVDQGQQVGLLITGTARKPILTVFSNPPMEQSDALSYLVTGKPLSQTKGNESNMVGAAAQALGSATGNLLAKSIGSRLGFDEVGVSSSDALGGNSAFTVGKYLSPRLYLSYGVGLFEPGEVITLRYHISSRWSFEAQSATDFNRASFNYRVEK